jgi:hypothetical protein
MESSRLTPLSAGRTSFAEDCRAKEQLRSSSHLECAGLLQPVARLDLHSGWSNVEAFARSSLVTAAGREAMTEALRAFQSRLFI